VAGCDEQSKRPGGIEEGAGSLSGTNEAHQRYENLVLCFNKRKRNSRVVREPGKATGKKSSIPKGSTPCVQHPSKRKDCFSCCLCSTALPFKLVLLLLALNGRMNEGYR
jgi:hypothetical protein